MPTRYDIICKHCGNPAVIMASKTPRFCSRDCYNKSKRAQFACLGCKIQVPCRRSELAYRKFCSHSCAATINGSKFPKRTTLPRDACAKCRKPNELPNRKFCSSKCSGDAQHDAAVERWTAGKTPPDAWLRKELKRSGDGSCNVCKLGEWMGQAIPLQLDHIDGNSDNSSRENLRLICPNCHAQTPTYTGRNRGNGRKTRRDRYRRVGELDTRLGREVG